MVQVGAVSAMLLKEAGQRPMAQSDSRTEIGGATGSAPAVASITGLAASPSGRAPTVACSPLPLPSTLRQLRPVPAEVAAVLKHLINAAD